MIVDLLMIGVNLIIFLIYGTCCIVGMIFAFSYDLYEKLDSKLNLEIFSSKILNPLGRNIFAFEEALKKHNTWVGVCLILLSLIDLTLWFNIINNSDYLFSF